MAVGLSSLDKPGHAEVCPSTPAHVKWLSILQGCIYPLERAEHSRVDWSAYRRMSIASRASVIRPAEPVFVIVTVCGPAGSEVL